MNALIIGYGSIGSRHAQVLKELGCHTAVLSGRTIDFQPHYCNLKDALEKELPDYVVVANTTAEHSAALTGLKRFGYKRTVLVEKPLFAKDEKIQLPDPSRLFIAYNLRFHPVIQRLKAILQGEKVISVQCYVGQYLPGWRPSQDYRQGSSAAKRKGGGVLRDLSHELDYLTWIFGPWTHLTAIGGHYSHLETDTDDAFSILLATEKCPAMTIQLNYLDRTGRREILVNTDLHTLKADLIHCQIQVDNGAPERFQTDRDLTYRLEHQAVLNADFKDLCTWEDGVRTVKMIAAIETSVRKKKWVSNPKGR